MTTSSQSRPRLNVALWIAQSLAFIFLGATGVAKLVVPIPTLAAMWVWPAQYPDMLTRGTGLLDLAGALGILLPSVTRILPGLTVPAALGCAALQVCAIAFHLMRGEAFVTPINLVVLATVVFVAWGRSGASSKA